MLNLRPFVVLGSPYALNEMHGLGFSSFGSVVNESYDLIEAPAARLRAALREAERLSNLPRSAWTEPALVRALIDNAKHVSCGGFRAKLVERAVDGVLKVLGILVNGDNIRV